MLGEQVVMQERQLDRVGDLFDLVVEAADVGIADVRHLLEQQVLDLGARQLLEQQVRADVEAEVVAAADVHAADRVGQFADPFLVATPDDDDAHTVVHHLLDRDDLTGDLGGSRASTTLKLSLSTTSEPRSSSLVIDVGVERDAHLAAAREDVDGVVVVLADDDAVRRRRLRELVDLVAQRGDVLARLAQGVRQLLVLADRLGELALRLEQPFLEGVDAAGRIGESRSQVRDLLDQGRDLDRVGLVIVRTGRVEFTVVRHGPNVHARVGNMFARTLPCKLCCTHRRSTPCAVPLTRSCY